MNSYTLDYINQTHFRQKKSNTQRSKLFKKYYPINIMLCQCKILLHKYPIEIDYSSTLYHKRGA
jgi:hypothetical protein